MRSMWKGGISFGLVMIPVRLYAATEQKDISFRQVHRADGGRIRFRRFCSACGEEVPYEDVVKGYELATGEMVVLDDEDMADLPLPTTKSIEVLHFTPAEQLDPILFNRSYFVEPEAAGTRAYVLLRDALEQSGRVAIAQVALRQREALATLRSRDGVLVLETLLWPDEVREPLFPFRDQEIEVRPQELMMAASLIDSMTTDFDPEAYQDGYREALIELVEAKVAGREIAQPGTLEIAAGPSTSLADALRASLAVARGLPDGAGAEQDGEPARAVGAAAARAGAKAAGRAAAKPAEKKAATGKAATGKTATGKAATGKAADARAAKSGDESSATGQPVDAGPGAPKPGRVKKPARKAS